MAKPIFDHEYEALSRWMDVHGRKWKSELRNAWFCGTYRGIIPGREKDQTTLQCLRNRIGPSGLDKLTAKQIRTAVGKE